MGNLAQLIVEIDQSVRLEKVLSDDLDENEFELLRLLQPKTKNKKFRLTKNDYFILTLVRLLLLLFLMMMIFCCYYCC